MPCGSPHLAILLREMVYFTGGDPEVSSGLGWSSTLARFLQWKTASFNNPKVSEFMRKAINCQPCQNS